MRAPIASVEMEHFISSHTSEDDNFPSPPLFVESPLATPNRTAGNEVDTNKVLLAIGKLSGEDVKQ